MKLRILKLYWKITRCYLRLCGAKVGVDVRCNGFPYIRVRRGGRLVFEDGVRINATPRANAHVVKGSTNFYVESGAELILKRDSGVSGSRIVAMQAIVVGERTLIGADCLICDSDMHELPIGSGNAIKTASINIGDDAFIGAGSIILKGVSLSAETIVASGSVVSRSTAKGEVVGGVPAQSIRHKGEFSKIQCKEKT